MKNIKKGIIIKGIMNKNKVKNILIILLNSIILISTLIHAISGATNGITQGKFGKEMVKFGYFKSFTVDSNVLMAIISCFLIFYSSRNLINDKLIMPKHIVILYGVGTTAVSLTLLTVISFLAPLKSINGMGFSFMFSNDLLFFHLLNPIFAIISFTILIKEYKLTYFKEGLFSLIPTFLYCVVYGTCVSILGIWNEFYGFTMGGKTWTIPIIVVSMLSVTFGISSLMIFLHNKRIKKVVSI